tara:strand:+ start:508 stop:912 length:405 start_codon:yes stop_codon:yes gene_type:complete
VKVRTIRGLINPSSPVKRLLAFDGRTNTAYKITQFEVMFGGGSQIDNMQATLGLDEDIGAIDFGDNRSFGWACGNINGHTVVLDPEHLVIGDLFIRASIPAGSQLNYLVTLEQIEVDDNTAVITLIKERAQDDL